MIEPECLRAKPSRSPILQGFPVSAREALTATKKKPPTWAAPLLSAYMWFASSRGGKPLRANPRAGGAWVLRGAAHYLGDLCAYRVVTRTERVVRVAAHHAVAHPGLHEGKERAALQHIRKGSQGRIEDVPTEH